MTNGQLITRYCSLCSWSHTSRTQEENDAMLRVHTLEEHCAAIADWRGASGETFHCDVCSWEIDPREPGSAGALGRHMWEAHDGFHARLTDAGRAVLASLHISAE